MNIDQNHLKPEHMNDGVFCEDDIHLVYNSLPKPDKKMLKDYLKLANDLFLSQGVTSVASDDFSIFDIPYPLVIEAILECYQENLIQVKITEQVNLPNRNDFLDFIEQGYVHKKMGSFKMGPLKLLADGSLGGRTAALKAPYSDGLSLKGTLNFTNEELFDLIHLADQNDMDVAIHAIGDLAMDQVLSTIIKSLELTNRKHHHHAIIHAQLATPSHIRLMKKYQIGAIVQPVFINSDIEMIHSRLGARTKQTYLFHRMVKAGLCVGFSTDAPVEKINPFENLYVALTRKSMTYPKHLPHLPKEAFTLEEALECYGKNNLIYTYETIQSSADYIILDRDPFILKPDELKNVQVLETWIQGKQVYQK